MESSKNYNKNVPVSTKLSGPSPPATEAPPMYLRSVLCPPQHVGALLPPNVRAGRNRRAHGLRPPLLDRSGGSPQLASRGSEQQLRHAGQRSERLLRSRLSPIYNVFSCNSLLKSGSQSCEKKYHKLEKPIASTCKAARGCQARSTTNGGCKDCRKSWMNWRH